MRDLIQNITYFRVNSSPAVYLLHENVANN